MFKKLGTIHEIRTDVTTDDSGYPDIGDAVNCGSQTRRICYEVHISGTGVSFNLHPLSGEVNKTSFSEAQTVIVSQSDGNIQKFIIEDVPFSEQIQAKLTGIDGTSPSITVYAYSLI